MRDDNTTLLSLRIDGTFASLVPLSNLGKCCSVTRSAHVNISTFCCAEFPAGHCDLQASYNVPVLPLPMLHPPALFLPSLIQMAVSHWIANKPVSADKTFAVKSATDDSLIHEVSSADEDIIDKAISSAQEAYLSWKETTLTDRSKIFLKAADLLEERAHLLVEMMQKETYAGHKLPPDLC